MHLKSPRFWSWAKTVALASLAFYLVSCGGSDDPGLPPVLVTATQVAEVAKPAVDARLRDLPGANLLTRHSVRVYRIVYRTRNTDNVEVEASGALLVPVVSDPKPLLSLQHATITQENQAPSNYGDQSEAWTFGTAMASIGYVVSAPDYLGFGASRTMPHPYEHAPSLASASLDMLRAVREFCRQEGIALNEKLFLAGYSLGGSATMALHKAIEEQAANEFTVTASAPGAGAYNKTGFARFIMGSNQPLSFIDSYLWVLDTYNRVYKINRPVNQIIDARFNFVIQNNQLTGDFSRNPQELFTPAFRQGIIAGTDAPFVNALRDNDVHDWRPRAPIRMFHGSADDFVPITNARDALAAMRARGATNVELQEIPNGNHFTSVSLYILGMYSYFEGLR
jgi:pimeloyl-ACP methyl ester carboxylesterase